MRDDVSSPLFAVGQRGRLILERVFAKCPEMPVLHVTGSGSRVVVDKCAFLKSWSVFLCESEARLSLNRCHFQDMAKCGAIEKGGVVEATDTKFVRCSNVSVRGTESKASFRSCRFEGALENPEDFKHERGAPNTAFIAFSGSQLTVERCFFKGWYFGIDAQQSNCRVTVADSVIINTQVAFSVCANASGQFRGNRLDCWVVLQMFDNVKGQVEFSQNRITDDSETAFITKDEKSKRLKHDFVKCETTEREYEIDDDVVPLGSRKQRSKYTQKVKEEVLRGEKKEVDVGLDLDYKECNSCGIKEDVEAGVKLGVKKFKFCPKCKKICYCSAKCQTKDWPDHKITCPKMAAAAAKCSSAAKSGKAATGSLKCGGCDKREIGDDKFLRCRRCKVGFYCSAECQKSDWYEHKRSCSEVDKAATKSSTPSSESKEPSASASSAPPSSREASGTSSASKVSSVPSTANSSSPTSLSKDPSPTPSSTARTTASAATEAPSGSSLSITPSVEAPGTSASIGPTSASERRKCDGCSKSEDERSFKKCTGCKKVAYCSKECQRRDWLVHMTKCDRKDKADG